MKIWSVRIDKMHWLIITT